MSFTFKSQTRFDIIATAYIFIKVGHVQKIDTNDTLGRVTLTTLNTKPLVIGSFIGILNTSNTLKKYYFKLTQPTHMYKLWQYALKPQCVKYRLFKTVTWNYRSRKLSIPRGMWLLRTNGKRWGSEGERDCAQSTGEPALRAQRPWRKQEAERAWGTDVINRLPYIHRV